MLTFSHFFLHCFFRYCIVSLFVCLSFSSYAATQSHVTHRILILGDSLSAAYQIPLESGWVSLLQSKLLKEYPNAAVLNASIAGDTTANGLQRLPHLLNEFQPTIVILELGGNDGLRGLPLAEIEKNLTSLIEDILRHHAHIILVGVTLPPNYGAVYTRGFSEIYTRLSQKFHIALIPFLLEGIALRSDLMQEDGIHPKREAQPLIVNIVWPYLMPLLALPTQTTP